MGQCSIVWEKFICVAVSHYYVGISLYTYADFPGVAVSSYIV